MRISSIRFLTIAFFTLAASCARQTDADLRGHSEPADSGSVVWAVPDERQVEALRAAHAAVRDRLTAGQWTEAAALFSASGVERVARLRELALYGGRDALAQLSTIELLYVLLMRKLTEAEQLRDFSERELLAWALENKMLGPHWRQGDKLVELEVLAGTRARAKRVYQNGHPSNLQVFFDRESDGWRVSLDGEFLKQEEDFKLLASDPAAAPPAELATTIYETRTMSKLTPEAFVPPFQITED